LLPVSVLLVLLGLRARAWAADAPPLEETAQQTAALSGIRILPSYTDPAIKAFDTPHYIYVNRAIVVFHKSDLPNDRHELLLWLTGTGGQGKGGADAFCVLAANLGYHVVLLMYPDSIPATICKRDSDPGSFEKFRMAIIAGGSTQHLTVSRTDSIENRFIKLLLHLKRIRSREDWEQFLNPDSSIKWETLVLAGQSQGGGHAALLGIKHRVARVICTGAPKDYSDALGKPAAWLFAKAATPKSRFFTFNHQQDRQGCTPEQQLENLRAMGLDSLGPAVDVDTTPAPYQHSRILTTNYPGKTLTSKEAHTSVINPRMAEVFQKVWKYMLTEK
jgi:pimeloyl-ACP methyl ester carboxylesterase